MPETRRMTRSSAAKQRDDLKAAGKRTDDYKTPTAAGKRSRATEKPDNRPTSEASEKSTKRQKPTVKSSATKEPPSGTSTQPKEVQDSSTSPRTRYWLFKSEPESRISERGHDVKFSLDDLIASPNSTAPWDGVRNYGARNNLRAMKVGDLGFFYHSNCKEPGIVGIVEVAAEAVPDEQAFDPNANYYDPTSKRENPKWFQTDVRFKRRMKRLISLQELKSYADSELNNMPLLKLGRLSVSEVPANCWEFILSLEKKDGPGK